MPRVILSCPVRACGEPLARHERSLACPRGHTFDVARSGYVNLLQPQDRRSREPGDPKEAVAARRRLLAAGHEAPFVAALLEQVAVLPLPPRSSVLDVGCGEGTYLSAVAGHLGLGAERAHGLDLSTPAIDLAARTHPDVTWIVANADRRLPYLDGSFDLALSLTARRNGAELRRVLTPDGRLLVAVPGPDDLIELRAAVLGEGERRDRAARTVAELEGDFVLESHRSVRWTARLDSGAIRDVLTATYRGGRESRRERAEGLTELEVTFSRELLRLKARSARA